MYFLSFSLNPVTSVWPKDILAYEAELEMGCSSLSSNERKDREGFTHNDGTVEMSEATPTKSDTPTMDGEGRRLSISSTYLAVFGSDSEDEDDTEYARGAGDQQPSTSSGGLDQTLPSTSSHPSTRNKGLSSGDRSLPSGPGGPSSLHRSGQGPEGVPTSREADESVSTSEDDFEQFIKQEVASGELYIRGKLTAPLKQDLTAENSSEGKDRQSAKRMFETALSEGGHVKGPMSVALKGDKDTSLTKYKNTGIKRKRMAHANSEVCRIALFIKWSCIA